MQKQNDLAINLLNLFDPSSYKEFGEGYFVNQPKMKGFYYIFKKITKPKFCLIVNSSELQYPSSMTHINEYVFIIINAQFEEFIENLADKYFPLIMDIIEGNMQKKNERNLPYGYYLDENGELKVDFRKAEEVRKIYDLYIESGSVRAVASELRTNFSHIREVLHDNEEYSKMQPTIVPLSKTKEVREMMAGNIRGGAVAKRTLEDEIADARRRRKQKEKMLEQ